MIQSLTLKPDLAQTVQRFEAWWAGQFIDRPPVTLSVDPPSLNAVQWVYGAGNGPAARWLQVYRQIRQAGKSLQLIAQDPADALIVLEQLGPEGVWISVEQPFASLEEAAAFIKDIERLSLISQPIRRA